MNVPLPVTVIFNPSRAVSDAEPKISHPILAACADATTLAENSSARDVSGAAVGAPLSHARARPIASTPRSLAPHPLPSICASLPIHGELRMHVTEAPVGTAAAEHNKLAHGGGPKPTSRIDWKSS